MSSGFFPVMDVKCVHCRKDVRSEDGLFYALTRPYYCLLHRWCAPFYNWNNTWPHSHPLVHYNNIGGDTFPMGQVMIVSSSSNDNVRGNQGNFPASGSGFT